MRSAVIPMACRLLELTPMTELMTIGYEGLTPKGFLALLERFSVDRILDVRELASSRRAGFSKTALAGSLARSGISYTHLSSLGCPREIRHSYREDQNWKRYTKRFCAYLETRGEDLALLAEFTQSERCCLLCYEKDFNFCHRSFVAERLNRFISPLRIQHLTGPIQGQVAELRALAAA